jgi:BMFP domain-containing protein YqiC
LISYKDLSNEILNIIKSKKDEIIFKLDLSTKEELEIVKKRLEILEKKLNKKNKSTKIKKVKKS